MHPVEIVWEKEVTARFGGDIRASASPDDVARMVAKSGANPHRCFRVSPRVLIEIPDATWGHGDVLIYLPEPGWLVRRNYVDYWYVDVGVVREIDPDRYCWTDLWLDVTLDERATRYRVHDAHEMADAVAAGAVAPELVVRALRSFHALVEAIAEGAFPSAEIREAEAAASAAR